MSNPNHDLDVRYSRACDEKIQLIIKSLETASTPSSTLSPDGYVFMNINIVGNWLANFQTQGGNRFSRLKQFLGKNLTQLTNFERNIPAYIERIEACKTTAEGLNDAAGWNACCQLFSQMMAS